MPSIENMKSESPPKKRDLAASSRHVNQRIDMDEQADAADHEQHDFGQRIDDQADRHLELRAEIDPRRSGSAPGRSALRKATALPRKEQAAAKTETSALSCAFALRQKQDARGAQQRAEQDEPGKVIVHGSPETVAWAQSAGNAQY